MASPADDSVIIDREHFETLVRRANAPALGPPGLTILVSRAEYDALCLVAKQYANLRRNLLRGGVDEQTVDILSADDASNQNNDQSGQQEQNVGINNKSPPGLGASVRPPPGFQQHSNTALRPSVRGRNENNLGDYNQDYGYPQDYGHRQLRTPVDPSTDSISWGESGCLLDDDISQENGSHGPIHDDMETFGQVPGPGSNQVNGSAGSGQTRPTFERRTLQFVNIPPSATHADVAAVLRGGLVLEIYIRTHDRSAMVSFHRGADALAFYEHARKHDFYVKNKRVEVRWADRQFTMNGMVASKVQQGATRNLIIYRRDPRITERMVRDDLDHIHNLVVISVVFSGTSCTISTNSVHNALFARSCLMSRAVYKGSRIEWAADECAKPLEKVAPVVRQRKEPPQAKKPPVFAARNRFQLLNLDGGSAHNSDDGEVEDRENREDDDDDDADENETQDTASDITGGGVLFSTASLSSVNTIGLMA